MPVPAPEWPITLEEGSDFDLEVTWESADCSPKPVTGYGATFEVRNNPDDASPLITASVANSQITIAGADGRFSINVPAASVDAILDLIDTDYCRYTMIIWPSAASPAVDPKRLIQGPVAYSRSYAD